MNEITGARPTTEATACPAWCDVLHEDEAGSARTHEAVTEVAPGVLVQATTFDDHEGPRPAPYFLVDVECDLPLTADELRAMAAELLELADAAS